MERRAVYPEFVRKLQYDHKRSESWVGALEPLNLVIQFPSDIQILKAQGRNACVALWTYLKGLPEDMFAIREEVFLLGYMPVPGVVLDAGDLETLMKWQQVQGQLFQWALDQSAVYGTGEAFPSWRAAFGKLLEDLDTLLLPRLDFWLAARIAEERGKGTTRRS